MSAITYNTEYFIEFVSKELMIAPSNLNLNHHFRELDNWSSLNALILISRINEETGITINASDLSRLTTLGDLYMFLSNRG
jgi:acyl carrier protein